MLEVEELRRLIELSRINPINLTDQEIEELKILRKKATPPKMIEVQGAPVDNEPTTER